MLGIGLIQLVLVIATAYIANERNRNWMAWAAAAVFFPVIALIVVALLDPVRQLTAPPGFRPTLAVCPACGRIAADPGARFCSHCGTALPQIS